mmetsp:Transcript_64034/g.73486  ORF Transcript_64034/g.73486 Transcript_64034/m.73486 type:complete len:94 (-) Transcript_64034:1007-1288(-)
MGKPFKGTEGTRLDVGIEAIKLMLQHKILYTKTHEIGLVLCGTEETENQVNEDQGEGYENVTTARYIEKPDLEFFKYVVSYRIVFTNIVGGSI